MKFRLLLPALLLLVFLLVACASAPELRNPKMLKDTSLISGTPCKAPCWNGITPGVTGWDEAVRIIQSDSRYANLETQDVQEGADKGAKVVTWQQKDGDKCCQMYSYVDSKKVRAIGLQLAPGMTLKQLIEAQGAPTYLLPAGGDSNQAIMALVYPDVPMVVYAFVAGTEAGALSETSEIILASYLTSADMQDSIKKASLHKWEGYKSYRTYNDSPLELTPEPESGSEATPEATAEATPTQ